MHTLSRRAFATLVAAALAGVAGSALAQSDFPNKPIRMLVPFAPGGVVDTTARILGQKLTERVGWNIVIENRPGGNGFIATTAVAKSPADGYTLLVAHTGEFSVNPALFPNVPYDVDRDFVPITMISDTPMLLLAPANAPFNTVQELVREAKAKPGQIGFSTPGTGSINHLAGEWFAIAAGVKLLHVPYKGGAPAATAVAAGEIPLGVVAIPGAMPHLKSGRVKVIGLTTAKRAAYEPKWPTAQEGGVKDLDASNWVGLFAPKGTPQPIVDRIHSEVLKALEAPDVKAKFAEAGGETAGMSQAAFAAKIKTDLERYRAVVKQGNLKPE
jgi:tripartite-type tricarboxylate transporter receptor subunit TctC